MVVSLLCFLTIFLGASIADTRVARASDSSSEASWKGPHARMSLIAEHGALRAGSLSYLGLHFKIDPEWHLYWNGRSDTGAPISFELDLPEGFTVEDTFWPTPERYLSPGDILDHIYEHEVTVLLAVRTEPLAEGTEIEKFDIECRASWVTCNDVCIAEGDTLNARIAVVAPESRSQKKLEASASSSAQRVFAEARRRIPGVSPIPRLHWANTTLEISIPGTTRLRFFPYEDSGWLSDPIVDTEREGSVLRLRLMEDETRIHGVVEAITESGSSFYVVESEVAENERSEPAHGM